ncbi:NAD-dependent epimerase/dehydratase family protein [bacterium CPR1]|nr:NAD-dependent epimerase/dehydratase family protein [bacterium CPR1]
MRDYEFLTGATGLLGSYLMRDALRSGRKVAVLARGTRWMGPQERIATILERLDTDQVPVILEGNLNEPHLGLSEESRRWVADHCEKVVHCAAALQFVADGSGEPYRTNVDGTRHTLRLCQSSGIKELHLVSTAYVSGSRTGTILEDDFDLGQSFSNDYERSKLLSEHLVRTDPNLESWTIYRPSVIVGDYETGFTSSYTGVYSLLRLAWLFSEQDGARVLGTLGLDSGDRLNLVPVNWVSAALRRLLERGQNHGQTYHLTSPHPTSAGALYEAATRALARPPQVPAAALDEALRLYRPYLNEHPHFDSTHTERDAPELPCPVLDEEALDRLVRYASERGFELPPEWNLRTRMEALRREGIEERTMTLEVKGPEGGAWSLAPGEQGVAVYAGTAETASRAFCNSATLEELVARKLNLEGAIYSGLLVLEGPPASMDKSVGLLEGFLDELREARIDR